MSNSPVRPAMDTAEPVEAAKVAACTVPEGTLVTFIDVSTPVLGSYPRQQVPKALPPLYDAISKPLGNTPCWFPESKDGR